MEISRLSWASRAQDARFRGDAAGRKYDPESGRKRGKGLAALLLCLWSAVDRVELMRKGRFENRPFGLIQKLLESLNVLCLPALGAFDDIELNALAFLERTEAVRLDCTVMHEDIVAIFTADKSEAFGIVKPFYCSLFHCVVVPCKAMYR
jgi:hypothetical protein